MSVFKAYDIRGVYNQGLDDELAYKVGYFLPELLDSDHVLIGRDARESSPSLFENMCRGVLDRGCDVWDIGIVTTPTVYYAGPKLGAQASLMITASHNPKEYNGFKISKEDAKPVGQDTGLSKLEELCKGEAKVAETRGKIIKHDIREGYIEFVNQWKTDLSGLKIVFDPSNGMEGVYLEDFFNECGADVTYINLEIDCTFPNHEANPLVLENVVQLQDKVKELGADIGVMFDGDADRVAFVDEKGQYIFPDIALGLMAQSQLAIDKATVIYDVRTSKAVIEEIIKHGGTPEMCKVGHVFAKALLRERNGILGGELAGHYYFRDNNYCDSGIIGAMVVLGMVAKSERPLSEMIGDIQKYAYSGEINFKAENKDELMAIVRNQFDGGELNELDGIRVDYKDWWYNIRKSNTEPYLRLVIEADNQAILDDKVSSISELIQSNIK
ncbi:phosphomannomutase/phosphoglucomutase [bacterium]|nr:phosphomannomutase/phosphoglucomutase [bacterium]